MRKVPIVEIFTSIQAEGPNLGRPSIFIRFGGCNLRCRFKGEYCDTPYAVFNPEQADSFHLTTGYEKWNLFTAPELVTAILAEYILPPLPLSHIVFTGGEPLLYQDIIEETMDRLDKEERCFTYEFETNGAVELTNHKLIDSARTSFTVSVKLKSSNQEEGYDSKRVNPAALLKFPYGSSRYKFVISDHIHDIEEIRDILQLRELPVYLMPEGVTREQVISNSPAVVKLCIEHGFIFTPREHIVIWDSRRGV